MINIIGLLLSVWPAQATLKTLCVAQRVPVVNATDLTPLEHEFVTTDLVFKPYKGNEFISEQDIKFAFLPEHTLRLTIYERLSKDKVTWSSQLLLMRNQETVDRSNDVVSVETKTHTVQIRCDAFESPESLTEVSNSTDPRQRARENLLSGYGARKTFAEELEGASAYELYLMLLRHGTGGADQLRTLVANLERSGFTPEILELNNGAISAKVRNLKPDVQVFQLRLSFSGKTRSAGSDRDGLNLVVRGSIHRPLPDKLIRNLSIYSISVTAASNESGGGGSTSGGRITGGK